MKHLQLEWLNVNPLDVLRQMHIDPDSPSGVEALARIAVWEKKLKPTLNGLAGYKLVREPRSSDEPGTVYCAITLGTQISEELDSMSQQGKLWEATLLDTLADHWLVQGAQGMFEEIAQLCRTHGWGMSTRKMPGSGYPLSLAGKIIRELNPEPGELAYMEPGFLEPIKSLAYFYDISFQGTIPFHDEECSSCGREDCPRRQEHVLLEIIHGEELISVPAVRGANLLKLLQDAGCAPDSPCAGRGVCGRCNVEIQTDAGPRKWVLACKTILEMPAKVWIPAGESWQMAVDQTSGTLVYEPFLRRISVKDYFEKKQQSLSISLEALRGIQAMKDTDHTGWFIQRDRKIMGYSPETAPLIGAAIDLGSTTVVVKLVDLESGRILSTEGFSNPMRAFGADILSRLGDPSKFLMMTQMIRQRLGQLFETRAHGFGYPSVYAVAGNNAMVQILLGLSSEGLARAPYWHWLHARAEVDAGDFWPDRQGIITVLPGASPFTGGDLTAGVIHCGIHETRLKTLYLDLGTNGEMALGNQDGILVTAAAAGPAFESLEGSGGVGAVHGAIKKTQCLGSGRWHVETIEDMPAVGLCGSGLISFIAELIRYGFVGSDGTLEESEEGSIAILPGIAITQQDIRNFQLAKAAFRAGIEVLLKQRGWLAEELEQVIVAGGFSRDITPRDLMTAGFLPEVDPKAITMVGNACMGGVVDFLLNKDSRRGIHQASGTMTAVNLSEAEGFESLFIKHINFR